MKNWKITWYEYGLKTKVIKMSNIYNLAADMTREGIPEWCVISIEQLPEATV